MSQISIQLIRNKLSKVQNMRYITDAMFRYNVASYRSRIPFLSDYDVRDASWLMSTCCMPIDRWNEFSNARVRDLYALNVTGTCTDRSITCTPDYISILLNTVNYQYYGIQMHFVNVNNRAHYPVVTQYLNDNPEWEVIQRITSRRNDKPVEYIIARQARPVGGTHNTVRYVCFTTLWDYDLNKSLLYVMLNHLLTTPFTDQQFNRTATNRTAYVWFTKYFEGQDVNSSIFEYLDRELLSKLHDIAKAQLAQKLTTFSSLKATYKDNTARKIEEERDKIRSWERSISASYENIRIYTLQKLQNEAQGKTLDALNSIFAGMLNKGVLTGFSYRSSSEGVNKVAWQVQLPITYWEEDEAKYWIRELQSNKYKQDLFKAMFIDKLIVPYCEQTIMMNLENGRVTNEPLDIEISSNVFPPHPHVGIYNCFGNNAYNAQRAIMNQDLITATTICMNAVMQLNMTDHTVTSKFMNMCMFDNDYRNFAFLLYKGKMYTPNELYNLYKLEGGFHNGETNQINPETAEENA